MYEIYQAAPVSEALDAKRFFGGTPAVAFAVSPYTGAMVMIRRGESCLYGTGVNGHTAAVCAAESNRRRGVTPAQAAAMLAGAMEGWDSPRANPMRYDAMGVWRG